MKFGMHVCYVEVFIWIFFSNFENNLNSYGSRPIVYCTTKVKKMYLSHEGDMDNSPEFYRLFFLRLIGITYQISHK